MRLEMLVSGRGTNAILVSATARDKAVRDNINMLGRELVKKRLVTGGSGKETALQLEGLKALNLELH